MAYWRRVLGPHFPIPDSMLRTAWRHFETCECGYRCAFYRRNLAVVLLKLA
eukprot:m.83559 g.83559  ORF g.83559 m.83559 type:complete len:51 (+) comp8164_c0_seq2:267-419(+)